MQPGIYDGIPMADYVSDKVCPEPSLSSSCAFTLSRLSPLHAYTSHPRLGGNRGAESGIADHGSVAHDLFLGGEGAIAVIEPDLYPAKNGNVPDGWTNQAIRDARDAARANGLTPILAHEMPAIRTMVEVANEFIDKSELAGILKRGKSEQTIVWRDGSAWCRVRPDWLTDKHDVMLSYKTTDAKLHPETFARGIFRGMGYDFGHRFYARGLASVTRRNDALDVTLVQQQSAPYSCALIGLSPAKAMIDDDRVERSIRTWERCLASGEWPGYGGRIYYVEPTAWELAQAEQACP